MTLKHLKTTVATAVALLLCCWCTFVVAQEKTGTLKGDAAKAGTIPGMPDLSNILDPAFDQHFSLMLLGQAWADQDAALLTDVALQIAEGERILQRQHKAVSSDAILQLAAKVAADGRDQKTLDRLAKIAQQNKNDKLSAALASSRKLASSSRKDDPAMSVSVTDTKPDQLSVYKDAINEIRAAALLHDQRQLDVISSDLEGKKGPLGLLTDQQHSYLKKVMGESRSGTATTTSNTDRPLSETLDKLKQASRHGGHSGGHGGGHGGHGGVQWGGWGGWGGHGGGWGGGWHDTSHWDYHPGGFQRHGNHFHYVPGHYDWHQTGHHH